MSAVHIFISYSHKDEAMVNALRDHLAPLRRQGLVDDWHDRKIVAGDDWAQEISDELRRCQVILLLLAPVSWLLTTSAAPKSLKR